MSPTRNSLMIKLKSFEFNLFGEKTYIIYDSDSRQAAIVDPGMMNESERSQLDSFIEANSLSIKYLINTHLHIDHVLGVNYVKRVYGVGVSASCDDSFLGDAVAEQSEMFHLKVEDRQSVTIDNCLKDGDVLRLGDYQINVLTVPGHSPGSIALYCPNEKFVLTGDALFRGSIGRTDLPGGDYGSLIRSICNKLLTLPDDTAVYPGHGPATTIGQEKEMNPYI